MGSKNRIAKDLLPIITKYLTKDRWYVEPFCGGCNMIDKVKHDKRIANDNNKYLIAMWNELCSGAQFPKIINREFYEVVREAYNKQDKSFSDSLIGWVGFTASFNGRFFDGGYCGGYKDGNKIREHINNIERQIYKMYGCIFKYGNYTEMSIPNNSVVYCDPPYKDTKQYSTSKYFDHDAFWEWCRQMTAKGHDVLVSEYQAPDDFVCVWQKQVTNAMNTKNTYKPTEKLFVHGSIADKYITNELKLF